MGSARNTPKFWSDGDLIPDYMQTEDGGELVIEIFLPTCVMRRSIAGVMMRIENGFRCMAPGTW